MSRHRRRVKHFSRKSGPRKALIRGLMVSLVEHGRITTTVEKAKELRRHIEPAITLGKKNNLATRRLLISRIANEDTANAIMTDLSPRFETRPGGYTRIIKIGRRPGDTAEMAFIEFVDYDYTKKATAGAPKTAKSEDKAAKKTTKKAAKGDAKDAKPVKTVSASKKTSKLVAAKKKSVRKMQNKSRQESRA